MFKLLVAYIEYTRYSTIYTCVLPVPASTMHTHTHTLKMRNQHPKRQFISLSRARARQRRKNSAARSSDRPINGIHPYWPRRKRCALLSQNIRLSRSTSSRTIVVVTVARLSSRFLSRFWPILHRSGAIAYTHNSGRAAHEHHTQERLSRALAASGQFERNLLPRRVCHWLASSSAS